MQIDPARYGPGCDPQGYYIDVAGFSFYVGKRPGWGWAYPTVTILDAPF